MPHILELLLKMLRIPYHIGKGGPYHAQLGQGRHFLLRQFLLVLLQRAGHVYHRVEALLFLGLALPVPALSRK